MFFKFLANDIELKPCPFCKGKDLEIGVAENLLAVPLSVEDKLGNFKKEKLFAQMNKVYALNEHCNEIMKGYVNDY